METIQFIVGMVKILLPGVVLISAAVVFILTFLIIVAVYKIPKFRNVFQGPDIDFFIQKAANLEEAMEFLDIQTLNSEDKKRISQSLKSVKKPVETLLIKLA